MLNTVSKMNQNTFCWKDYIMNFFSERIVKDVAIYMCIVLLDMKIPVYNCDWHLPHFILLPVIKIYLPLVVVSDGKSCLLLEALCGRNMRLVCYCYICWLVYLLFMSNAQMLSHQKIQKRKMCRVHLYISCYLNLLN